VAIPDHLLRLRISVQNAVDTGVHFQA